jgi:hypothetical protein
MAGSEWPNILETTWIGIPCLTASVAALCLRSCMRTSAGNPASSRSRLKERTTKSRRRTLPPGVGEDPSLVFPRAGGHPLLELARSLRLEDFHLEAERD